MRELSEMNKIVKDIYTNPFIRENWELFVSIIGDLKKRKLQINLIVDTTSTIDIAHKEQLNIKEFKKAALSLQFFELVAILKGIENSNSKGDLSKQYIRDEYFFISKANPSVIDFIVPNNEFLNFFFRNYINFRLPDFKIVFNYLNR